MTQYAQHITCDGGNIAKDDLREIEMLRRRDEIWQELFQNTARIRRAMRGNAWLRPIFRKYKRTCRDILDQKNKEATIFTQMCDYEHDPTDLKLVQAEMMDIHAQIKTLEEMRVRDNSSASSSDSDLSSSSSSSDHEHEPTNASEPEPNHQLGDSDNDYELDNQSVSSESSSSSSSSPSSSSSSEDMDMEDFL